MADPWYVIVRPIWPQVVAIVKFIWHVNPKDNESTVQTVLQRSGDLGERAEVIQWAAHNGKRRLNVEYFLAVASLGGETSFTAFLEGVGKHSAGGELLCRELEKMWTSYKDKAGKGASGLPHDQRRKYFRQRFHYDAGL